jgi:beta-galactosidase/beta-glucuronidase
MHTIRLHGPWDFQPLGAADDLSLAGRIVIPADWSESLGADFRGRVRYTRHFHRPTGLDEGQRVYLSIDGVVRSGIVSLNGETLGAVEATGGPFRFDVTDRLALRNALVIEVESLEQPGGLTGGVRLEIAEA